MRHFLLPLLAALCLTGCQDNPAPGMKTSAQGHDFAFLPMPGAGQVSIEVAWPMPWPTLEDRNAAVPHVGAKLMLAGGAGGLSPAQVQDAFADLNAQGYLYPTGPTLRGGVIAAPEALDAAVRIANTVLRDPALPQEWLARISEDMAKVQSVAHLLPATQGWQALRNIVLGDQPFARYLSLNNSAAIRATTQAELRQWHTETVVSAGAMIAVAGPLTAEAAGMAVDALLDGLPAGPAPAATPTLLRFAPHTILLHVPTAPSTTLGVIARIPASGDDGEVDDLLASLLLGGDDQSLLSQALNSDLHASYGFSAGLDGYTRQDRILVMTGVVETAQTAAVRDLVVKTYASLFAAPVSAAALDRWKAVVAAQLQQGATLPAARSSAMIEAMLDGVDPLRVLQLADMLARATPESVRARIKTRYTPADQLVIVAVSPDANALPGACVITMAAQAANCP